MDLPDLYRSVKKHTKLTTQEIVPQSRLLTDTATGPITKSILFTFDNYDHLYYVSRVYTLLDQLDYYIMAVFVNGMRVCLQCGVGSAMYDDCKDNPFLLRYGDLVEVRFILPITHAYNLTAILEYYSQPSFDVPLTPVTVALSSFVYLGAEPFTVPFISAIHGNPTTLDWDFGDGSAHSSLPTPTHIYTSVGNFTPSLYGSKTGSWDKCYAFNRIHVVARENLLGYPEYDPSNYMTVSANQVYIDGPVRNHSLVLTKDFGSNHFNTYWFTWSCRITYSVNGNGMIPVMFLSNATNDMYNSLSYKICVRFYFDGTNYNLDFFTMNSYTITNLGRHIIALNTVYYCELVHFGGGSHVYFNCYSDAARQSFLFGYTLADGYETLKFRYLTVGSSYNDGNAAGARGYINDFAILQGDP